MKNFVINQLLDAANICNLDDEKKRLFSLIEKKGNVVVYGPRNYGKTSLVRNVIAKTFAKTHKKSFVFFVDLMSVKSMSSISKRLRIAFEKSFEKSFPVKTFIDDVKEFLTAIRPSVSFDAKTGAPSISIEMADRTEQLGIIEVFQLIQKISQKVPCLVILDEFQDIVAVPESQALFRQAFELVANHPTIVMGSKHHILSNIFAKPNAPLAFWGEDVSFSPIKYATYHKYIMTRFKQKSLALTLADSTYLQDRVQRIPESVNMVCQELLETHKNATISTAKIDLAIASILEKRAKRYESLIAHLSDAEESVLTTIAKEGTVSSPTAKSFVNQTTVTPRSVSLIVQKLLNQGILELIDSTYRIQDPLFNEYLVKFR